MDDEYDDGDGLELLGDLVPDNAIPMWGLRMVVFLDGDDEVRECEIVGKVRMRDVLGHLESEKFQIMCGQYGVEMSDG